MDLPVLLKVLYRRGVLRRHETWDRERLAAFQSFELGRLREHAYPRSPFYRGFHRGLEKAPLECLPILTKKDLMENFDGIVTDRELSMETLLDHATHMKGDQLFNGKYRVVTTSGTTGLKGLFLYDPSEWAWVMASYARAFEWGGMKINLLRHGRMALVSSRVPWHQSTRVGATADSPFLPTLRIDSLEPVGNVVRKLNDFQPGALVGYADMIRILADEQQEGALRIHPSSVFCASEVLTGEAREKILTAWGVQPFDVYGATETAGIASECGRHQGLHLYEDLVIPEVVDDGGRPVPDGTYGSRLLVTVLFSRTLPLIRYELTDSVALERKDLACPCGRPFQLLRDIQGRAEDALSFPGLDGNPVAVHPNLFHAVMEGFPVAQWQVVQEGAALRLLVSGAENGSMEDLGEKMRTALRQAGAVASEIRVEQTQSIEKTALGKRKLVMKIR